MNYIEINTYREPSWGSLIASKVAIRKDHQDCYYVDDVRVIDMHVVHLFTVLGCADGKTHVVLTVFFRQVDRIQGEP